MKLSIIRIGGCPAYGADCFRQAHFYLHLIEKRRLRTLHVDITPMRVARSEQVDQVKHRRILVAARYRPNCVRHCQWIGRLAIDVHFNSSGLQITAQIVFVSR